MAQQVTQLQMFFMGVRQTADRIRASVEKSTFQPKDGSCLIVTLQGPPGRISECLIEGAKTHVGTAAYCLQSGTHRLADEEECRQYYEKVAAIQADRESGVSAGRTNRL